MKKNIKIILSSILFSIISISVLYGENTGTENKKWTKFKSATTHFTVYSYESTERAIELSYELEKLYAFYIKFFEIQSPEETTLSVTLFQTEEEMRTELKEVQFESNSTAKNEGFVLSVSTPFQKKAHLYFIAGNSPLHTKLFNAYTFLLFFETQFPNTSPWVKEGLTAYFSMLEYFSKEESHFVTPNYNTMEKLQKEIRNKSIYPLQDLLSAQKNPSSKKEFESFRVASWGLIQYIFNKGEKETANSLLHYIKSSEREEFKKEEFILDQTTYEQSIKYIATMESPSKLIETAISLYQENKYNEAVKTLERASKLSDHYYIPYYTGLIRYKNKNYKEALTSFEEAKKAGLPEALSCYSEGLCYWNLKERIYAEKLLKKAEKLNPKRFKKPVEKLLQTQ